MQQLLTPDAFRILSESYIKIGELGLKTIDLTGPAQQASINKLIECTMLYDVIMEHIVLNGSGTAIAAVLHQDVEVINDLLFSLKGASGLYSIPAFPTPLTTYQFNFGDANNDFNILPGNLGDLIVHNGTTFTNFGMGAPGTVLTSTPTGLIWSSVVGNGLPSGGSTNQYLRKNSNTSFDAVWDTLNLSKIPDVTASAAEVNILDGVIISTTELNYSDGLTGPIQGQLDGKLSASLPSGQFWVGNGSNIATPRTPTGAVVFDNVGVFSIAAGAISNAHINNAAAITRTKLANGNPNTLVVNSSIGVMTDAAAIAPDQALVSDPNGIPVASPVTAATLVFLDATSSVQAQLDNKLTVLLTSPAQGDVLTFTGTNWINLTVGTVGTVLTSNGASVYWGSATANGVPAGGAANEYLRKVSNSDYDTEWHTLLLSDITDVSTSSAVINNLSGLTVGSTELNFSAGLTNNIQLQIDGKQNRALAYNAMWVGNASNLATELSPGTAGDILTMVGGVPQWQTPTPPGNVSGVSPTVVNTIARWNDIAGSSIKGSGITIDNSNNITGAANITVVTGGAFRTATSAGNTALLQAYDVDGAAYVTFATLTANNTPTFDLATGTTIGAAYIYRAGGTDIPLLDGGTGASLTSPGADRIMFWDQSAGSVAWLQVGSNLSITGTTLNATGGGGTTLQQREEPGTTYTVQASDDGYIIYFTDVTGCLVTIPTGLTANFSFTSARAEGAGVINHQDDGTSVLHTIGGNTDIQNENTAVTWVYKGTNDWYGFGALGSSGGGGSVNSVAGTTNRISIGGTSTDPIIDISAAYVGQASITTLGTVTTGTWSATTIAIARGGTGLTALGSANQLLRVNAGATALEYFTAPWITGNQTITLSGDVSGSGTTAISVLLDTVNSNVGTFGSATQATQFTVNGKGLITAASNVTITPAAASITGGQALTKTDDTNVTLTLGGTPTTALLTPTSITIGWAGQLAVTRGGTGLSSVSQGDILYGSASNTLSALAKSTSATRYLSNTGTSNNPAWAQIDLTNGVTGVLPIVNGGTGASGQAWWALTGTSTLTGVATITSNAASQHIFTGTFTTTANTQFYQQYSPTATIRNTASDTFGVFNITPTVTTGANTQTVNVLDLSGTYALGATTGTVIRGILYNPTLTGNAPTGHTALAIGSGRIGLRNLTPTATLDITGEGTTAATFSMRIRDNSNVTLFQYGDDGFFRFGSLGSPPILGSVTQTSTTVSDNKAGGGVYLNTVNGTIIGMNFGNNGGYAPILRIFGNYNPTLVGATAGMGISITPVLNQTGAAVASYTGILYNPTVTAMVGAHYGIVVVPTGANSGFGITTPTAKINIAAHTTAAGTAPIKLTSGTAMTTPEDGAFEYHSSHLYFTIGSTRYQLDQQGGGGSISGLTAGRIPYAASSTTIVDEAGFEYDATNNRLTVPNIRSATGNPALRLEAFNQTTGAYLLLNDTGELLIRNQATSDWLSIIDGTITGIGTHVSIRGGAGETGASVFGSGDGSSGVNSAAATTILAGNAFGTGNGNGGAILLQSGTKNGSGLDGRITLDPRNRYTYTTKDIAIDDSSQGLVLRASDGTYWRLVVAPTTGVLSTVSATLS